MKNTLLTLIISSLIIFSTLLSAQATADLFSQEGLSINAYHDNFYHGTYSRSYTFLLRSVDSLGSDTLTFVSNQGGGEIFLRIEGKKVYHTSLYNPIDLLIYDFDVQVGDVFYEGIYLDYEVVAVDSMTLLNGNKRKRVELKNEFSTTTYIEGIGDIKYGLLPDFSDIEGYDVFVCAKLGDQLLIENPDVEDSDCEKYSCISPRPEFELAKNDFTITTTNNSLYGEDFLWDFGDGHTSTEVNPIHTYETAGCYSVILKVGNDCFQGQTSKSIPTSICIRKAWEESYSNDSMSLSIYAYDVDIDFLYNDDYLFKVTNGGQDWKPLSIVPTGGEKKRFRKIAMWDENRGLVGREGTEALMVTSDGGESWTTKVEEAYWVTNFVIEESGKAYIDAGVYSDEFYRTMNYGDSWEVLELDNNGTNNSISEFLFAEADLVYAKGFNGRIDDRDWRLGVSEDNGITWTFLELPFNAEKLQFVDSQNGFGSDFRDVWYTTNGGLQWNKIPTLSNISRVYFHSATHGWVIDNTGVVLYSTDRFETMAYTACGNDEIYGMRTLSDSTAVTTKYSIEFGTTKLLFNKNLIGDCTTIIDMDGDGFSVEEDCDDNDPNINPDAEEIPNNGIDEDCDGMDLVTSSDEISTATINIHPNPVVDYLTIEDISFDKYEVFNISGVKVLSGGLVNRIDFRALPKGMFFINLINHDRKNVVTRVVKL